MTTSPLAAREGTTAPQWPIVKKCCRHLVPSSDFFVQSYAAPSGAPLDAVVSKKNESWRGSQIIRPCLPAEWMPCPFFIACVKFQGRKDTQTQRFHKESHAWIHLLLGAFNPWNSLCSGFSSLWNVGKTQTQRILKGEGAENKSLCWISLGVFVRSLEVAGISSWIWLQILVWISFLSWKSDLFWSRVWCIPGIGAENKKALFGEFLVLSAVLRVRGRKQNPRQTPVRTKVPVETLSEKGRGDPRESHTKIYD